MTRSLAVLLVGLSLGVVGGFPHGAFAAIEIALVSGQQLRVDAIHVDENANHLVAHLNGERVSIKRFISWDRIRSVRVESETLSWEQLIARFGAASMQPADKLPPPTDWHSANSGFLSKRLSEERDRHPTSRDRIKRNLGHTGASPSFLRDAEAVRPVSVEIGKTSNARQSSLPLTVRRVPSIQRISIDAQPRSSRGKVDWDALTLNIVPIDQEGYPTFARGTLRATLWGVTRHALSLNPTRMVHVAPGRMARPRSFSFEWVRRLASWTRPIDTHTASFRRSVVGPVVGNGPEPLTVVLPMPRPLPENDETLTPFGVLHVTLLVPGQGVFEATRTGVPLKHVDPFRSQMVARTGSRFLQQEGTTAGR